MGTVWNPRWDNDDVPLAQDSYVSIEIELDLAVEHDNDLLFGVGVPGCFDMRSERHEAEQHPLTEDGTEVEPL
jgi:hypothetical protein